MKRLSFIAVLAALCSPASSSQASWYGPGFHGRATASGEKFDQNAMTCAHRTAKFGTRFKVTNLRNGKSAVCRVNDRGPFIKGRVIDVSKAVAKKLDMLNSGTARVRLSPAP